MFANHVQVPVKIAQLHKLIARLAWTPTCQSQEEFVHAMPLLLIYQMSANHVQVHVKIASRIKPHVLPALMRT